MTPQQLTMLATALLERLAAATEGLMLTSRELRAVEKSSRMVTFPPVRHWLPGSRINGIILYSQLMHQTVQQHTPSPLRQGMTRQIVEHRGPSSRGALGGWDTPSLREPPPLKPKRQQ